METITLPIQVPKDMAPFLSTHGQEKEFERNALMLFGLIQSGKISHGRAAEILGVSKWNLIEFYNAKGMPYLNQSREDLLAELAAFDQVKRNQP